jgi:hypothetical protein
MSDAARVMVVNNPDEREVVVHQAHRLGWGGILAGVLAGLFTYVSLLLLGIAIGFIGLESVSLSGVAIGAVRGTHRRTCSG